MPQRCGGDFDIRSNQKNNGVPKVKILWGGQYQKVVGCSVKCGGEGGAVWRVRGGEEQGEGWWVWGRFGGKGSGGTQASKVAERHFAGFRFLQKQHVLCVLCIPRKRGCVVSCLCAKETITARRVLYRAGRSAPVWAIVRGGVGGWWGGGGRGGGGGGGGGGVWGVFLTRFISDIMRARG